MNDRHDPPSTSAVEEVRTAELYGIIAQFDDPETLLEAANRAREAGYTRMDAYTPFPVQGLVDALGVRPTRLGFLVLAAGITGMLTGFFMQYWAHTVNWPRLIENVGGRPHFAWPAFIPITFEMTILLSVLTAVFAMILLNGLPQPYHPVFNAPGFERATRDGFFLCIEATDPLFDPDEVKAFLEDLGPVRVSEVEP